MKSKLNSKNNKKSVDKINLLNLFPEFKKKQFAMKVKESQEEYLTDLKECYTHKGLALYIGSGVSKSIGLPNWNELIKVLTIDMMTRKVETAIEAIESIKHGLDIDLYFKLKDDVERNTDYNRPILLMARALKDNLGNDLHKYVARNLYRYSKEVRRYINNKYYQINYSNIRKKSIRERFLKKQFKLPSSPLLDSIIAIARPQRDIKGVQAIVNYNYDDILEEKLKEEQVKCVTIKSGKDYVQNHSLHSYHVHGVISLNEYINRGGNINEKNCGNFVFSEDEYHNEYADPYRWSNMTQISLMGRYTGLFIGLSLEDPNIRRLLDVTHKQFPENINYAILPRKRSLGESTDSKKNVLINIFEQVETQSFEKIGVKVIWAENVDEIPEIINKICKI